MNKVKSAFSAYLRFPLVLKILIGLLIGTTLGILVPNITILTTLGELFTGALKAIAPVLVFVLIISSLSSAGKGLGARFSRIIFLYMLSTFLAAAFAVVASFIFPVTVPLGEIADGSAPESLGVVLTNLLVRMVENPVSALIGGNYLSVLTWSIGIGIAIRKVASENTKSFLSDISSAISSVVGHEDNHRVICNFLFFKEVHQVSQALVYAFNQRCVCSFLIIQAHFQILVNESWVALDRSVYCVMTEVQEERNVILDREVKSFQGLKSQGI